MTECLMERDGRIAVLTLNRPDKLNAYNAAMHKAIINRLDDAEADPGVRAIVITGAGRAFCAGADIANGFGGAGFEDINEIKDGIPRDSGGILNLRIYQCDKPIIAAINGPAVGIGATMLLPMDIRIAANTAKFAFPFSRRGIMFDGAASWFLPRIVGWAKAREWILRGHVFSAEEALAGGLVSQLTEPDDIVSTAMNIAQDMAQNCSPTSLAKNKQLMRASFEGNGPMAAHMLESDMLNTAFTSADCQEGVASFLEKRPPIFEDYEP